MQESTIPKWKEKAEELFFIAHKKINDIAVELGISRKAVSAHLKICEGFSIEKERRKAENAERRKEYQAGWEKTNRSSGGDLSKFLLKRQHEIDVMILSRERFFNETGG